MCPSGFSAGLFSVTNIIFIFESLSTLDSTFTSAAKLLGPEFAGLLEDGTPRPPQAAKIWCANQAHQTKRMIWFQMWQNLPVARSDVHAHSVLMH